MLSISRIRGPLIMIIFPLQKYIPERSPTDPSETPMERVKKIFVHKTYEPISKELQNIYTLTFTASISGAVVGGILHMRGSVEKFIENNQATRFYNQFDAKRELQHSVMMQFLKGAYKLSWRAALFTAIFISIQTILTAYYGKFSILHYMAGAGTAGFLFKISLGLRGSLVGLIVGSIFGLIGGLMHLVLLRLTGLSVEDLQSVQQQWILSRNTNYKDSVSKVLQSDIEEMRLTHSINEALKKKYSTKEEEKTENGVNK